MGQNLSEMAVRTFARIKKVIWDQLLATEAEIIEGKLYFCLACENPNATFLDKLRLELQSVIFGRLYPAKVIFSSKSLKNSSKKTLPFNSQLSDNNSVFFLPKRASSYLSGFRLLWVTITSFGYASSG